MICVICYFVILLFFVVHILIPSRRTRQLGNQIPGPKPIPLLGNILDVPNGNASIPRRVQMIQEYGHIVRLWLGPQLAVLISDPKENEIILSSTENLEKSQVYTFLLPWLGTGLLTSTGQKWHSRRKALTPAFHFKILDQFIDIFNTNSDVLLKCLEKESHGNTFNVYPYICRYTLDVICETAMGTTLNSQTEPSSDYFAAVRSASKLIFERVSKPLLWNRLIFALTGRERKQKIALETLHSLTNKVIREKSLLMKSVAETDPNPEDNLIEGSKRKTAFLELILKMALKSEGVFKEESDIREEVDTFMFEGHDTTTSSICFTLHVLSKHPDVQEKIFTELESLNFKDRKLTLKFLQEFKYLERVVKESLRLYPSVPLVGRILNKEVKLHSGYTLPQGTSVGVSVFFTHRNSDYYDDPETFNPDNFLPEKTSQRHPYAYIPFSAGPRNCIGQKFAMIELKMALAKIISKYKIEDAGQELNVKPNVSLTLTSDNQFHIRLIKRE